MYMYVLVDLSLLCMNRQRRAYRVQRIVRSISFGLEYPVFTFIICAVNAIQFTSARQAEFLERFFFARPKQTKRNLLHLNLAIQSTNSIFHGCLYAVCWYWFCCCCVYVPFLLVTSFVLIISYSKLDSCDRNNLITCDALKLEESGETKKAQVMAIKTLGVKIHDNLEVLFQKTIFSSALLYVHCSRFLSSILFTLSFSIPKSFCRCFVSLLPHFHYVCARIHTQTFTLTLCLRFTVSYSFMTRCFEANWRHGIYCMNDGGCCSPMDYYERKI